MKKRAREKNDEMLREYDFSQGVRGKYAQRYARGSNVVVLEPDVAKVFPNAEAVTVHCVAWRRLFVAGNRQRQDRKAQATRLQLPLSLELLRNPSRAGRRGKQRFSSCIVASFIPQPRDYGGARAADAGCSVLFTTG
jgi:hypothetical protein